VVLQVAAATGCKCYGIEKAEIPARYSEVSELGTGFQWGFKFASLMGWKWNTFD
jgi:hypothetical protein